MHYPVFFQMFVCSFSYLVGSETYTQLNFFDYSCTNESIEMLVQGATEDTAIALAIDEAYNERRL